MVWLYSCRIAFLPPSDTQGRRLANGGSRVQLQQNRVVTKDVCWPVAAGRSALSQEPLERSAQVRHSVCFAGLGTSLSCTNCCVPRLDWTRTSLTAIWRPALTTDNSNVAPPSWLPTRNPARRAIRHGRARFDTRIAQGHYRRVPMLPRKDSNLQPFG